MQRRLSRALLRPGLQRAFGSRSTLLDGHGDGHSFIIAGPLVQDGFVLQFSRSLAQRLSLFSKTVSRWQTSYAQATGNRSFSAAADPQLADTVSRRMAHSLEKALASQHPPTDIHQVKAVVAATLTKLLCEPPAARILLGDGMAALRRQVPTARQAAAERDTHQLNAGKPQGSSGTIDGEQPAQKREKRRRRKAKPAGAGSEYVAASFDSAISTIKHDGSFSASQEQHGDKKQSKRKTTHSTEDISAYSTTTAESVTEMHGSSSPAIEKEELSETEWIERGKGSAGEATASSGRLNKTEAEKNETEAEKAQRKKEAAYRYGVAQRERRSAMVMKAKGKPPQQDFTVYHENLKAEAKAAREKAKGEKQGTPAHSPEAMQVVASAVASVLSNSEQEVLAMLQRSAYGKQQDPLPLPDTAQAKAALQEMLIVYGAQDKFEADATVWKKVLERDATLLSCTAEQIRNTVSFLEMLSMTPAQIAVCLSKAPLLLRENLEDKLLPLCDYLNSIGLDLDKQRRIVTWRPLVLTKRLNWVKGQCAFLAGHGIQGDLLAAVLIKSSSALLVNRRTLAQSIKYLYDELGCTHEDISRCAGLVGVKAATIACRVAWLKHIGRQVELPRKVTGGAAEWTKYVERHRAVEVFGPEEPIPLWMAVTFSLKKLCALLECKDEDARKFKGEWMTSDEGIQWSEKKGLKHQQSSADITGDSL